MAKEEDRFQETPELGQRLRGLRLRAGLTLSVLEAIRNERLGTLAILIEGARGRSSYRGARNSRSVPSFGLWARVLGRADRHRAEVMDRAVLPDIGGELACVED